MKKLLFSIVCLLFAFSSFAQYVDNGQDDSSIKWRQIETKNFRLIYPAENESLAQKYANVFQTLYNKEYSSLEHKPSKIPIILHTQGGKSNGMVVWAPKRMELFAASMQHNDFTLFQRHLGVHEYRHVVQIDKMNQGLTKFGSILFGEHSPIGVMGAYVPMWFLEGDAVAFETGNTKGGRGRLPCFEQVLRAQLVEKGSFSYDKAVFGSFNDFTPNRYNLGYYMIANARKHYGAQLWEKTIDEMAQKPWNICCFQSGLKKGFMPMRDSVWHAMRDDLLKYDSKFLDIDSVLVANKYSDSRLTLFHDNMCELGAAWKYEDRVFDGVKNNVKSKKNNLYASYKFPQYTERGTIIAYKDALDDLISIVEIASDGTESLLCNPSAYVEDLDYANEKLVWSEYKVHYRWENGGRTVLALYDVESDELKRFSYKDNICNPCISQNGQIVCVGENSNGITSILRFTVDDFFIELIKSKGDEVFQMPTWINEKEIALVVLDRDGKHIESVNIETKERKKITESENADIANPKHYMGKIYYSSSFSGRDEICSVDIVTGEKKRVTKARFGNRYPSLKAGKLLYSSYCASGYEIHEDEIHERDYGQAAKYDLAEIITEQEKPVFESVKDTVVFDSRKYSKINHLFKIHSWAPTSVNGFDRSVERLTDLGVSFASQNDLSTMFLVAGYRRDSRYNSGAAFAQMKYKAFWPVFDIKLDVGSENASFKQNNRLPLNDGSLIDGVLDVRATRLRTDLSSSMTLPFNFSQGAYSRGFLPYFEYEYYKFGESDFDSAIFYGQEGSVYDVKKALNNTSTEINVFSYNMVYYNLRNKSHRDINPRWGQVIKAGFIHSPFGDRDFGTSQYASIKLYVPGLLANNSLSIYGGYQHYSEGSFIRNLDIPRGMSLGGDYTELLTSRMTYTMPLLYPDHSLGGFVYTKRLYAILFYDTVKYKYASSVVDFSTGVDLRANIHVLRFKAPINIGLRCGYESQTKSPFVELLFNLSFDI